MVSQYQTTDFTNGWKVPFNLALLLHVLMLSSVVVLPKFLHNKPIMPEIYSVDLVNIAENLPQAPPAASPSPPRQSESIKKSPPPKAVEAKKTAPIAPPVETETSTAPVKVVSLKPLKRKLKKKIPADTTANELRKKREAEERRRQLQAEERRRQLLAEARRQKAIADAEAKVAANEAVKALRQSLLANSMVSSTNTSGRSGSRQGGSAASTLEAQYFARIFNHLHQYWSLPEIKTWNPSLSATVVVTIAKNGQIVTHNFEKRSGDPVFDRFVTRAMQEANPLPAIPAALKKKQYTIGLRFRPGGIH